MVHHPIDDGAGHLVIAEHHAPLAELDIGRDQKASPFVAVAQDLE